MDMNLLGTVSNTSVMDLIETCCSLKVFDDEVLNQLGIERSELVDPEQRFPERKLIELWQWIDRNTAIPDIGLHIGRTVNPSSKGVLASWVSQCETLDEAVTIFSQYIPLMNPSEKWTKHIEGDSCVLVFSIASDKGYPTQVIERSMSAMINWGRMLSTHSLPLLEVCFSSSRPSYHAELASFFGCSISYDSPRNTLSFDRSLLELPISNGNRYLKLMMESKAKEMMNSLTAQETFEAKTRRVIPQVLSDQGCIGIDVVCERLNVSRQTLYRKLKEEGTDFSSLCDTYKKDEALRLICLRSDSVSNIALHLGYKDNSSFYKAFKRWFGMSPSMYLARASNG